MCYGKWSCNLLYLDYYRWRRWKSGLSSWNDRRLSKRKKNSWNRRLWCKKSRIFSIRSKSSWQFSLWKRQETRESWRRSREPRVRDMRERQVEWRFVRKPRKWKRQMQRPPKTSLPLSERSSRLRMRRRSGRTRSRLRKWDNRRELSKWDVRQRKMRISRA